MRPLYIEMDETECFSGTPQHLVGLQYYMNVLRRYRNIPIFLFGFQGFLSHGSYNGIQKVDVDLENFISDMKKENLLENTIFILMSDHGPRFSSELRSTLQGKLEERMPIFSFLFPPWFASSYPEAYNRFLQNQHRLSTPYDIHDTLTAILNKQFRTTSINNQSNRSQSLFSLVPSSRSCESAAVEAHWCACQTWKEISNTNALATGAAATLVKTINNYTDPYSSYCQRFRLTKIDKALVATTNKEVRRFIRKPMMMDGQSVLGWDTDGEDVKADADLVQVSITADPGSAKFEASMKFNSISGSYKLKMADISRTNKYGTQPACIENINLNLRKYCVCK